MDIVKKNLISIVFGVVALLAIVAVFIYPLPGMYGELDKEVKGRASVHQALTGLVSTKAPGLPLVPGQNEVPPLNEFPTRELIALGTKAMENLGAAATQSVAHAVEMNRMQPLVPNVLPNPAPTRDQINFLDAYRRAMNTNGAKQFVLPFSDNKDWIANRILGATMAPTEQQIQREMDVAAENARVNTRVVDVTTGQVNNQPVVDAAVAGARAKVPEEYRDRMARAGKIYVNFDTFQMHDPAISVANNRITAFDVFLAQTSLWTQEKICYAIANANRTATNVADAPVKHLLRVTPAWYVAPTAGNQNTPGVPGQPAAAPADPGEVPSDPATDITKDTSRHVSGRNSNPFYDVIRFNVRMRCDVTKLPQILADMQRPTPPQGTAAAPSPAFLTITNVNSVTALDSAAYLADNYVYGNAPVVEVVLTGEVLYLREWIKPLMPTAVRAAILAPPPAAGGLPNPGAEGGI
jgi:hypothetical protein